MKKEISTSALIKLTIGGLTFLLLLSLAFLQLQTFRTHELEAMIIAQTELNTMTEEKLHLSPINPKYRSEIQKTKNQITITTLWEEWWGEIYKVTLSDIL